MKTFRWFGCAVAALVCAGAAAGAKDLEMTSVWPHTAVIVDGSADQWAGLLKPLGDQPLLVGVQNDADSLYLCIKTSDPKVKTLLVRLGITVWADAEGKDKKAFGVRYPLGMGGRRARSGGERGAPPEGGGFDLTRLPREFELIGPTPEDRLRVPLGGDEPVQAAVGDDSGVMVIELRIPLKPSDTHPLAVGAGPGATIALGFATERPKFQGGRGGRFRGGFGGGGFGGGRGGGRGYGGGERGRGEGESEEGGGGGYEMAKPFEVWAKVTLATAPTQAPAPGPVSTPLPAPTSAP